MSWLTGSCWRHRQYVILDACRVFLETHGLLSANLIVSGAAVDAGQFVDSFSSCKLTPS